MHTHHRIWRALLAHQHMPAALGGPPRGFRVCLTFPTMGILSLTVKRANEKQSEKHAFGEGNSGTLHSLPHIHSQLRHEEIRQTVHHEEWSSVS